MRALVDFKNLDDGTYICIYVQESRPAVVEADFSHSWKGFRSFGEVKITNASKTPGM